MARSHLDIRTYHASLPGLPTAPNGIAPGVRMDRPDLAALQAGPDPSVCVGNIENFAGWLQVPVGLAGPLRIHGLHARGDFFVPLATTEGALVASYHRGCRAIGDAGGCTTAVLSEGLQRAPAFRFRSLVEAGSFALWASEAFEAMVAQAATTTRHGVLRELRPVVEGNHVWLILEYTTGDAAGQNMVTLATEAVCRWIEGASPVPITKWYIEGNMSGDKKACGQTFGGVRGRKVCAEAILPESVVEGVLGTTATELEEYWKISASGGALSGSIGFQGHYANGLAALYLATGQDVACVAESAVGLTRMERTASGDLYASVTLPDILVGTVGGGTRLPTQTACLEALGLPADHPARALSEIAAGLCLAGELSIMAAIASGNFARAHRVLSRRHRP